MKKFCWVVKRGNVNIGCYESRWDALHKMLMLTNVPAMRVILRESCNKFLPKFGVGDFFAERFEIE